MKIRDLFVEVRLRGAQALKGLQGIDKASKGVDKSMKAAGKSATSFGAAASKAAKGATGAISGIGKAASAAASSLAGLAAQGFGAVSGALTDSVKKAIEFETSMAEISKVVDGLKDDFGNTTPEFDKMKESIFDLSSEIAIAPKGFADIISAAGQAGVANEAFKISAEAGREELVRFAADAAKMAVAFDMSADKAGEAMAKMRTGLGLSQEEVMSLAGTMNHLSNNMASSAPELVDVTRRVGALGGAAGLSGQQVAGLASAMIASGAKSNVAATGIKNFTLALAAGEAATKRQREGFSKIGMDAEEVAAKFTAGGKEAEEAIGQVLGRLKDLSDDARAAALMQIVGKESIGAIAPLVTQIDNYTNAMAFAADKTAAASSVQGEYEVRAKTTANAIQLLKNNVEIAAIRIGDAMLPALNEVLDLMSSPEANAIGETLITGITEGIAAIIDLAKKVIPTIVKFVSDARGAFDGFIDGIRDFIGPIADRVVPLFEALGKLGGKVMEVLGLAGDEGKKFGEGVGQSFGETAVAAIDAVIASLTALTDIIAALKPVLGPVAEFLKDTLGSVLDRIGESVRFVVDQVTAVTEAFNAFRYGKFEEAFTKLGGAILEGLMFPFKIVARQLVDLADAIPGASEMVPQAVRAFAGKTALAGVGEMIGKATKAGAAAGIAADEAAAAQPMGKSRAEMQPQAPSPPKPPTPSPALDEAAGGEGESEGAGGSGGGKGGGRGGGKKGKGKKGKGKKGKDKKEKAGNLLDQAVMDSQTKYVLGGSDRSTSGVGPSVTNMYVTFNMDIDARGNEGAAANVDRAGRKAGNRIAGSLRGVDQAAMRARAGGGTAAGAG